MPYTIPNNNLRRCKFMLDLNFLGLFGLLHLFQFNTPISGTNTYRPIMLFLLAFEEPLVLAPELIRNPSSITGTIQIISGTLPLKDTFS